MEFRSGQQIEEMKKLERKIHLGHQHLQMPFDFQHIQVSVWIGLIPATYLLYRNVQLLKLDTVEEYDYLKMQGGLTVMNICRFVAYLFFGFYMFIVFLNYRIILGIDSKGTW